MRNELEEDLESLIVCNSGSSTIACSSIDDLSDRAGACCLAFDRFCVAPGGLTLSRGLYLGIARLRALPVAPQGPTKAIYSRKSLAF